MRWEEIYLWTSIRKFQCDISEGRWEVPEWVGEPYAGTEEEVGECEWKVVNLVMKASVLK